MLSQVILWVFLTSNVGVFALIPVSHEKVDEVYGREGTDILMQCSTLKPDVSERPPLFSWTLKGMTAMSTVVEKPNGDLEIDDLKIENSGHYKCTITSKDDDGNVQERTFNHKLIVYKIPNHFLHSAFSVRIKASKCSTHTKQTVEHQAMAAFCPGGEFLVCPFSFESYCQATKDIDYKIVRIKLVQRLDLEFQFPECDPACVYSAITRHMQEIYETGREKFSQGFLEGPIVPPQNLDDFSTFVYLHSVKDLPMIKWQPRSQDHTIIKCPPGFRSDPDPPVCIPCLPGMFSLQGIRCTKCPADTYQDGYAKDTCKACPTGTSSDGRVGLEDEKQCITRPTASDSDANEDEEEEISEITTSEETNPNVRQGQRRRRSADEPVVARRPNRRVFGFHMSSKFGRDNRKKRSFGKLRMTRRQPEMASRTFKGSKSGNRKYVERQGKRSPQKFKLQKSKRHSRGCLYNRNKASKRAVDTYNQRNGKVRRRARNKHVKSKGKANRQKNLEKLRQIDKIGRKVKKLFAGNQNSAVKHPHVSMNPAEELEERRAENIKSMVSRQSYANPQQRQLFSNAQLAAQNQAYWNAIMSQHAANYQQAARRRRSVQKPSTQYGPAPRQSRHRRSVPNRFARRPSPFARRRHNYKKNIKYSQPQLHPIPMARGGGHHVGRYANSPYTQSGPLNMGWSEQANTLPHPAYMRDRMNWLTQVQSNPYHSNFVKGNPANVGTTAARQMMQQFAPVDTLAVNDDSQMKSMAGAGLNQQSYLNWNHMPASSLARGKRDTSGIPAHMGEGNQEQKEGLNETPLDSLLNFLMDDSSREAFYLDLVRSIAESVGKDEDGKPEENLDAGSSTTVESKESSVAGDTEGDTGVKAATENPERGNKALEGTTTIAITTEDYYDLIEELLISMKGKDKKSEAMYYYYAEQPEEEIVRDNSLAEDNETHDSEIEVDVEIDEKSGDGRGRSDNLELNSRELMFLGIAAVATSLLCSISIVFCVVLRSQNAELENKRAQTRAEDLGEHNDTFFLDDAIRDKPPENCGARLDEHMSEPFVVSMPQVHQSNQLLF